MLQILVTCSLESIATCMNIILLHVKHMLIISSYWVTINRNKICSTIINNQPTISLSPAYVSNILIIDIVTPPYQYYTPSVRNST